MLSLVLLVANGSCTKKFPKYYDQDSNCIQFLVFLTLFCLIFSPQNICKIRFKFLAVKFIYKTQKTRIHISKFIVASRNCSTKPLSDVISKVFKMIFKYVKSFYRKSLFYTCFKKFWVLENSLPVVAKRNKVNINKIPPYIRQFLIISHLEFYLKL